jgi:hypothetical protein
MVITLAPGLTLTIVQAQSIRSHLNSVHYSRGKSAYYTTVGSIVSTITVRPPANEKSRLSYFLMALWVLYFGLIATEL